MKRDTLLALVAAVGLHAAFFWGGQGFKSAPARPAAPPPEEPIPVIELLPLSPAEPASASPSGLAGGGPVEAVPTPAATPEAVASTVASIQTSFLAPVRPPALPGLRSPGAGIALPAGLAGAAGSGFASGLGNLFNLADLDRPPTPTLRVPPAYPFEMRRAGLSGEVLVGFIVDASGGVRDAHVMRASRREFADEAMRAVRQWQFQPGRKNGVPVHTRMQVPLVFNLQAD